MSPFTLYRPYSQLNILMKSNIFSHSTSFRNFPLHFPTLSQHSNKITLIIHTFCFLDKEPEFFWRKIKSITLRMQKNRNTNFNSFLSNFQVHTNPNVKIKISKKNRNILELELTNSTNEKNVKHRMKNTRRRWWFWFWFWFYLCEDDEGFQCIWEFENGLRRNLHYTFISIFMYVFSSFLF